MNALNLTTELNRVPVPAAFFGRCHCGERNRARFLLHCQSIRGRQGFLEDVVVHPGTVFLVLFISSGGALGQDCQMAKFDPFLSLDCAWVEGVGAQSKERKGSNFAA